MKIYLKIKKMKKIYLFVLITMFFQLELSSQVLKFKAFNFATKVKEFNDDFDLVWQEWSEWKDNTSLVVFQTNLERIKVFTNKTQVFDIVATEEVEEGKFDFDCVDDKGEELKLSLYKKKMKTEEIYYQLYIREEDIQVVFNMKLLED